MDFNSHGALSLQELKLLYTGSQELNCQLQKPGFPPLCVAGLGRRFCRGTSFIPGHDESERMGGSR
ncbi:hypothetical protein GJAV_G00049460 [Gymnothorax javanicus]|nr:hypothetical protein GJAV_G00049460 [Gymnothorax javanicus]